MRPDSVTMRNGYKNANVWPGFVIESGILTLASAAGSVVKRVVLALQAS
ncbi:MAG TPA: hypothetical protein VGR47_20225 [Terracidiphilus sp.]|nr:hypothetical protein [Terracidiphilus sp.]